jgi:hypothetical protein
LQARKQDKITRAFADGFNSQNAATEVHLDGNSCPRVFRHNSVIWGLRVVCWDSVLPFDRRYFWALDSLHFHYSRVSHVLVLLFTIVFETTIDEFAVFLCLADCSGRAEKISEGGTVDEA